MKWISVEERLPDYSEFVVIAILGCYTSCGYRSYLGDRCFYDSIFKRHENHVTHWMPIPKIPGAENWS
jgi:hypothetical protein